MVWRPKKNLHGVARFAREGEIRKAGLRAKKGIVLGRFRNGFFRNGVLMVGKMEHVLLEAPTGSGKGVGIVIPNLLQWPDSVVVLDIKRENYEITAGFRRKRSEEHTSALQSLLGDSYAVFCFKKKKYNNRK